MLLDIEHLRQEYSAEKLDVNDVDPNPFQQFRHWFEEAMNARLPEPNAMTLATVAADGRPAARIVLLKGFDQEGFIFYTNYESRKGEEMDANPHVALVFLWLELQRQVRIEGEVEKIDPAESTRYYQSRPKGSQIGAWASPQSKVIDRREELEQKVKELETTFAETSELPRPPHWGGYLVRPRLFEYWQGRASRLHDRIQYRKNPEGWAIERLAP